MEIKFDELENENDFNDVTLAYVEEHIHSHLKIIFHCDKCPAKFTLKNDMKKHIWTHTEIKDNSCKICQKLFSHESESEDHMEEQVNKFCFEYFHFKIFQDEGIEGRLFLTKINQNFMFQVF